MDPEHGGSGDQLRHLDVAVDEREPRRGILDLLSKLRPEWKTQHIQMKVRHWPYGLILVCFHWSHVGLLRSIFYFLTPSSGTADRK